LSEYLFSQEGLLVVIYSDELMRLPNDRLLHLRLNWDLAAGCRCSHCASQNVFVVIRFVKLVKFFSSLFYEYSSDILLHCW